MNQLTLTLHGMFTTHEFISGVQAILIIAALLKFLSELVGTHTTTYKIEK